MRSQTDFDKPLTQNLYAVLNPKEVETEGGFRTRNPIDNRWQRQYVHTETKKSKFNKTVEMALCLHGWEDPSKTQAMSLIVYRMHFSCDSPSAQFTSATVWFEFGEDPQNKSDHKANPSVVAYAPFKTSKKWNEVKAEMLRKARLGANAGAEYIAKLDAEASKEWEMKYEGRYFEEGAAHPIYNENTAITEGVKWIVKGKGLPDKHNSAMVPNILAAVLLKRNLTPTGEAIPFSGAYDSRLEAGTAQDIAQGLRKLFVPRKEDEAIYFNPTLPDHVYGDAGKKCLALVDKDNLGKLVTDDMLVPLCEVYGLGAMS